MRADRAALFFAPALAVALGAGGCGSDDASPAPEPGTGGTEAGAGGRDGSAGDAGPGAGGMEPDAAPPEDAAPPGPRSVALLHGLIDSPWVTFCFATVEDGVEGPLARESFPAGGLRYGESVTVADLPGGAHFGEDSVRLYVVAAASEGVLAGRDCRELATLTEPPLPDAGARDASAGSGAVDAGPSNGGAAPSDAGDAGERDAGAPPPVPIADVRMVALAVLPARALAPEESYLVAVSGCLGGPGVTDPAEVTICGVGYSTTTPTLATNVVRLSRETSPRAAGIQFLVTTTAFGRADLRLLPSLSGDPISVVSDVSVGALRPVRPYLEASAADIGAGSPGARVQVAASGSTVAAYDQPWDPTLTAGRIERLDNGETYTLVLLGPTPGFAASKWWNGALVTAVKNTD